MLKLQENFMFGVVFLLLCFITGYFICKIVFPSLNEVTKKTFRGETILLPKWFIQVPAWFLTGTLIMTWLTYLVGYCFKSQREPLFFANWIVMPTVLLFCVINIIIDWKKGQKPKKFSWKENFPQTFGEWIFVFLIVLLITQLMFWTFYIKEEKLGVGLSVFSDFSPHLGMIRSFSYGNNFPTQYAHFAGEDIRYHFMFQFLVGNLEYLGLRLDFAFNLPSIFSLIGTFLLLYVLAVKLTGTRMVGYLTALFFAFRSSPTFFVFLINQIREKGSLFEAVATLKNNIEFIGITPYESWGLWNLNVYCNQRHLAFSLMALLLALLLFLPLLYEQTKRLKTIISSNKNQASSWKIKLKFWFQTSFLTTQSWKIKDFKLAIGAGILLGSIAFFNGAVLIATLSILFVIAAFSDRRLEFLCMAVIATGFSFLQSAFFVDGNIISPSFYFGFLAEKKTIEGVLSYIFRLTGILPFVLLISFFIFCKGTERVIFVAFTTPFIMSFTLSLTIDVMVNHKSIMLSLMLVQIFAAGQIATYLKKKLVIFRIIAVVFIFCMTATGLYDYHTILVRNSPKNNLEYDLNDELLCWIHENTTSKDVFLTANYYLNNMLLGGAMLYNGWPYYAWSAGYDTNYRSMMVQKMYSASSKQELYQWVEQENIRYIVVDYANRTSEDYDLREDVIDMAFEKVYQSGSDEWMVSIYDTKKRK